jgi:phage shock protein A
MNTKTRKARRRNLNRRRNLVAEILNLRNKTNEALQEGNHKHANAVWQRIGDLEGVAYRNFPADYHRFLA